MHGDLPAAGCLALLWPALPELFAEEALRSVLTGEAATLAPIPRLALELRLAEGDGAIDLHQLITNDDLQALRRHLAEGASVGRGDEAATFLRQWVEDEALRREIGEIFLEWDQPQDGDVLGAPAIFLPIDRKAASSDDRKARREVIRSVLSDLGVAWDEGDNAVFDGFDEPVSISHIGVMLGRTSGAVRINYRGVPQGGLARFLRALNWPGDEDRAAETFDVLIDHADRVTVALDFHHGFSPRIGYELLLDGQPDHEPRWRALLRRFEAMGICSGAKAQALLAAPAVLSPEQAGQTWPAAWIVAAVRTAPDCRPWFDRRLSHLKLTLGPDGAAVAKAYLSGQHYWKPAAGLDGAPGDASRSLRAVIDAAVSFLLASRRQNGLWCDFRIVNGVSDEWVSAFVACALANAGESGRRAAIETAARLAPRQRSGGWGYNAASPPDADSTAWVLKLLAALGDHAANDPARAFLSAHLIRGDGFATYASATPLTFENLGVEDSGWRGSHACVATNAAGVLGSALWPALRSSQAPDGSWGAYWWKTDAMSTALAAEALSGGETDAVAHAVAWGREQLADDRLTAFDLAWLIRLLRLGGSEDRAAADAAGGRLAALQLADGSWPSGAQMLFPAPGELARDPHAAVYLDEYRVFTTAAALAALTPQRQADTE